MSRAVLLSIFLFFTTINLNADFHEGEKLFIEKCSSCHKEYISFKKLKENFFERNNTLLNLTIPTENMLAWAIMESSKKIGDPNDNEMRKIEIEDYLKTYLANPDLNDSICDSHVLKYYKKKEPMEISDEESELLAQYFMGYKDDRLKNNPKPVKILSKDYNEKEILEKAKKEGKEIIVFATSQTCYFCKKMKKEVLSLTEVEEAINEDFIFLEVDIDFVNLPFGLKKYFKGMTPTFFFLTTDGQLLHTYPGAWVKDDFLQILKENL
ncbi:thioredoxin family protein [Halarcobacter ebronensis]|uniref:Thioredoxin family protein n=1 Tax=Halarcobacter ebronensis TaxID=1462615 RepID=A0A4Q0YHP3_9BACT|nr:thioredoxin family protein [Halarcobacter ebronensis]RXJ70176.1 thioredoxin family protein [Halarcobacter ebronensis]